MDAVGLEKYIAGWVRCKELTLLASERKLKEREKNGQTRLEGLQSKIELMIQRKEIQSSQIFGITARNNGAVHDRFIVTNEGVWCIGSSLNHFAEKDTVLIKSPNPEAFRKRLQFWRTGNAVLLKEWK